MQKTACYTLVAGALFLLLLTVSVGKPGLPVTLKADEPAYYLMALSLAQDGDLECGNEDYNRAIDGYPYLPTENLILMTDRGGGPILFGKPYIYALLATPLAAIFGANGLVAFNALLFMLMVALGALYLRRFNSDGRATIFAAAFFLLSPTFHYVFWLQPEILNMASVATCLFFAFHRFEGAPSGGWWRRWGNRLFNATTAPWWSAAALAVGTYNKPVLALIGLPALYVVFRRGGPKRAGGWIVAAVVAMGVLSLGSVLLTGHMTPYLGVERTGLKIEDPAAMEQAARQAFGLVAERSTTGNAWSWIFRLPAVDAPELFENLGYFFWGRHTGLLLYFPFAIACLILFLLQKRRTLERWLLVAAMAAVAGFFLLFIPFNWHGGGGFIGNRYFIMAYPAFLFLVTSLRPLWVLPAAAALAGSFLGTILLTPFGAPVSEPTLQAHVRGGLFRHFPLELSLRLTVPGYNQMGLAKALLIGRKDVFRTHRPSQPYVWIDAAKLGKIPLAGDLDHSVAWVYGATETEILVLTEDPIEGVFFEVASWVPDNSVRFNFGGDSRTLEFADDAAPGVRRQLIELRPEEHDRKHFENGKMFLVYRLEVEPRTGRRVAARQDPTKQFFLGAQLRYLGRRDQVTRPEHYRIEWLEVETPGEVTAGTEITMPVAIRNTSVSALSSDQGFPVFLSYHWLDSEGEVVIFDGKRTPIRPALDPRQRAQIDLRVLSPTDPGRYRLALDAVREHLAWFSEYGPSTRELEIEVVAENPAP